MTGLEGFRSRGIVYESIGFDGRKALPTALGLFIAQVIIERRNLRSDCTARAFTGSVNLATAKREPVGVVS